ncbi:hypothetical protein ABZ790_26130 [Saccharopolyspora shandongensis]
MTTTFGYDEVSRLTEVVEPVVADAVRTAAPTADHARLQRRRHGQRDHSGRRCRH